MATLILQFQIKYAIIFLYNNSREFIMSKYQPLWEYVKNINTYPLKLSFDDIYSILGFPIDHSFLNYKKDTANYGFTVKKVSLKEKTVIFDKIN